jgi:hypothetical protein
MAEWTGKAKSIGLSNLAITGGAIKLSGDIIVSYVSAVM